MVPGSMFPIGIDALTSDEVYACFCCKTTDGSTHIFIWIIMRKKYFEGWFQCERNFRFFRIEVPMSTQQFDRWIWFQLDPSDDQHDRGE